MSNQVPGLIQMRFPHLVPLKAADGTEGIMIEFFRMPAPEPDTPVQIALTILQAEDLVTKLQAMIAESKAGRKPPQSVN